MLTKYGYEKAVQFDADGQHLPEYIAALEEEIDKGNKMVIGSRFVTEKRPNHSYVREYPYKFCY